MRRSSHAVTKSLYDMFAVPHVELWGTVSTVQRLLISRQIIHVSVLPVKIDTKGDSLLSISV
jgi:hypothetical protein